MHTPIRIMRNIAVATVAKSGLDGAVNQANWARLAVTNENAQYGTHFKVVVKKRAIGCGEP